MKEQDKNRKNKGILGRYGLIVSVLMLFSFMIIFSAGRIMFSAEGRKWREVGEKETVIRDRVILPKRGNIYTYDFYFFKKVTTSLSIQYLSHIVPIV